MSDSNADKQWLTIPLHITTKGLSNSSRSLARSPGQSPVSIATTVSSKSSSSWTCQDEELRQQLLPDNKSPADLVREELEWEKCCLNQHGGAGGHQVRTRNLVERTRLNSLRDRLDKQLESRLKQLTLERRSFAETLDNLLQLRRQCHASNLRAHCGAKSKAVDDKRIRNIRQKLNPSDANSRQQEKDRHQGNVVEMGDLKQRIRKKAIQHAASVSLTDLKFEIKRAHSMHRTD